ncbi:MAG: succinate dehydrogenase, cytochrome b556 subunit [Anaerolineae bacterium]|nr:succinate dehydrogenase, cytochrome b556 subunit [Candidatus Roseilinea sp.]MDW8451567.1 succinate dehydrogenase, cytochrome b556 subunit [Anaerolineae bacterium]
MLNPLITTARESLRYKGSGQILWLLHRITGLGVVIFLGTHIFGMSMAAFNPPLHDAMLAVYKTPLFSVGEILLAACLIFHAVNGTRIAILELRPSLWDKQEVATRWSVIITLILLAPTIAIMAFKSISYYVTHGVK